MAELPKPDLSYVCPHCGQKAVLGQHFCQTTSIAPTVKAKRKGTKANPNSWVFLVAGAFLLVAILWRWIGPAGLLLTAMALLGFLVMRSPRGPSGGSDYKDLVRMCGTEEAANSLIQAEITRAPKTSRQKAIRAALERYQRDLSR